jgi:hypothetical protein
MPPSQWIRSLLAATIAAVSLWSPSPTDHITVVGGTGDQRAMTAWAVGRFEASGLPLPALEIRFLRDRALCGGHLGLYADGVVYECHRHTDLLASRGLLHEIAHGWLVANLTEIEQERFLELRGLTTWNSKEAIHDERGSEQAAEIMAWALGEQGDGTLMPTFPDNDRAHLAVAYEALTGLPLPATSVWLGSQEGRESALDALG